MNSFISADNTTALWAFLLLAATIAIVCEQKFQWAAKVSGAVIALLLGLVATNTGLLPQNAPVYDMVWTYIVPLAIPLLLFHINVHAIFKESGRLLSIFLISSIGTILGVLLAYICLKDQIPEIEKVSAMIGATYTGGSVNFAAMVSKYQPSTDIAASTTIADNLVMSVYIIMLIAIAGMRWFRANYPTPYIHAYEQENPDNASTSETYWKPKAISLKDIAICIATSAMLVAISFNLSAFLVEYGPKNTGVTIEILWGLLSDKYLLLTSLTLLILTLFKKQFEQLNGAQELGTYAIYIFFVVIAMPASVIEIIQNSPLLFVFVIIVMLINLIWTLIWGKVLRFNLEEILLACNANIGGPTTGAALAISKGWKSLVGPILVVGTVGYIIGNYIGTFLYLIVT